MPKRSRKPADLNKLAARIVDEATDDSDPGESQQAAAGRAGGLKGGPARAEILSAEERIDIARKGAKARWRKP
jgi:hypothetical protein